MNFKIEKVADHYGREHQIVKLAEECGELIRAICKYRLTPMVDLVNCEKEPMYSLVDEIADVEIMIEQVKYLFDIGIEINEHKWMKVHRQLERMKEDACE